MRKKTAILSLTALAATAVCGQSLDQARKDLYYTKWESARRDLLPVVQSQHPDPASYYLLGEAYLHQGLTDSAGYWFSRGVSQVSGNSQPEKNYPLVYIGQADWMLATGRKDEAVKQIKDVLDATRGKDAEALLAAARANIDNPSGDATWALSLLEQAARRARKNPAVYVALGDAYRRLVDGSHAVLAYQQALQQDDGYAEAWYKLGKVFKTQDNAQVYLDRFTKAYAADTAYVPALYELYVYYFNRGEVDNARHYLDRYIRQADPSPRHAYLVTDLQYIARQYPEAIRSAQAILQRDKDSSQPRLYKLIAYCYEGLGDSAKAFTYIHDYFQHQDTANYVAKDFELMGRLLDRVKGDKAEAARWYEKAYAAETKPETRLGYARLMAQLYKEAGDRVKEAAWRGTYYHTAPQATNLDLYNWGLALYAGQRYQEADTVFALYEQKYPDQVYGYLWRAMCNALIDSTMELGLAVPHYEKLIEVALKDSAANKSNLIKAYGYLGAYKANVEKNYRESVTYFNKILELDPGNADATRYVGILQKWISEGKGMAGSREKESTGTETGSSGN
ncbi:MAG TPA: tetratricopeptide repeat protein [Chitinophagaceae bacterium]|nr:tetratricopeptide repeat protein [Chitinophagaceae bacterium]